MKKVLIDNCVPLNNGDAALVMGLYKQLSKKNYEVVFSCSNKKEVCKRYPKFNWIETYTTTLFSRLCSKSIILMYFWKLIIFIKLIVFNNEYKRNDIIISAPGGYIHSYYGIEQRMYILYLCKKWLHKSVGIYSQSIGNLSQRDKLIFYKYGKILNYIFARDLLSFERAKSYGDFNNIYLTKDAAFLLMEDSVKEPSEKKITKKVAISLRSWKKEGREMSQYFNLIYEAVEYLLNQGYSITFLSTCQGIANYTDDSITAKKFVEYFNLEDNKNVHIDGDYHNLESLQFEIKKFDFIIGTRLHMCLLSWINQIPAFNISYEEKGRESFKYLGISQFSVDFNSHSITKELQLFLNMTDKEKIFNKVYEISKEQKSIFNKLAATNFERIT